LRKDKRRIIITRHNRKLAKIVWYAVAAAIPYTNCVGGDACIQHGAFVAAAPWRFFQATPSTFRALLWVGRDTRIWHGTVCPMP
jgi:hypothetical protein